MKRKLLVLLLALPATLTAWAQPRPTLSCPEVPGLAPLLRPGHVVLLGEMHGTNESPQFLQNAVCAALRAGHGVTVGLETPLSETARVEAFLGSPGDADAEHHLLQGPIWHWVCFGSTPSDCGIKPLKGRAGDGHGVVLLEEPDGEAYHGHYHVGRLTASLPAAGTPPTVAITIDDLPYAGGPQRLEDATRTAEAFVEALARYEAPASGFVTGANVMVEGQTDARLDVLRRWRDGGIRLENHSFSHRSFHQIPQTAYLDDAAQGLLFPEYLMRERSDSVRFYRHPFNHTGNTETTRHAFDTFLEKRGLLLAPFTVEHADYLFNQLYVDARERADSAAMTRIGAAYLAQLDTAFTFAERLAEETFGRAIPQVFLIHSNAINAAYLAQMLDRLQARGYRFVSLDEAVRDPAYDTPERYLGNYGISWLHRWRAALSLENRLRHEPDPPRWIIDAYRRLQDQ